VNASNLIKEISIEELPGNLGRGGRHHHLGQINPSMQGKIALFGRQNVSGTYDYFFRRAYCARPADGKQRELP